ncbi:diguanylate cyclase DgcR [Leptospira bandrabouensis]|uniref:diguanylate cyclase DgcR n=1 Tax=Leptospira bandrabouensis TaxID=2484903 RepID=UPI0010914986|nr:diguanylate cyclase [Leptospira bandrabouensis]MCG6153975.1 diguanylate cyclase [Leptospira bandrabouensis]MCW7459829.1 diguanylate cyclase [Leptospira bandrabouensis]MCW7479260.1 diguanylate cyclase [Leptospira bandrabouensis]MCW7486945.1 diguanylate cyclase [Leptospira bandrabouensis]TGN06702.1 diguanylate cyclase [Leptospira bandrabouensis]
MEKVRKKILIIEDSELQRKLLNRWISNHGYTPLEAISLSDAREIISKDQVDVVLLDWELPDGSGIELISEIFSSSPIGWLPIIMVTGHTEPENLKLAIEAGATDYITKPAKEIELLARIFSALRMKSLHDQLRETAIRDVLTGLYNRRYMEERIEQEFQRCKRHKHSLSLAMIDIDFFKKVNDTYGHETGDIVLKRIAFELKTSLRKSDIISRFGGEEFVIVFPETGVNDATKVLDKIRESVSSIELKSEAGENFKVSFSGGVAGGDITEIDNPAELLRTADKLLYEAKSSGRNRIVS